MDAKDAESRPGYVEKAVARFGEIMAGSRKDIFEDMNRANKGELFVLHFLEARDTEVLPSELSAALNSSTARISALLGSLEKKGQIRRDVDRSNRRNILVTVTGAGRERVKTELRQMEAHLARAFTEMGETDALAFLGLTERFFGLMQTQMTRR